jgi:arylsulfatase A-like enzyme
VVLARDSYDDCIRALDAEIGSLLDELERRRVLEKTLVIITSDHGEEFNEHGVFNHGYSLFLHEVHVPLVVLGPKGVPAGRTICEPVSLRDLPATIVDLAGCAAGSPFPGHSLAALWQNDEGQGGQAVSPAMSEVATPFVLPATRGRGPHPHGYAMSLVSSGYHAIRDATGAESVYNLARDPLEQENIKNQAQGSEALREFRASLLRLFARDPIPAGPAAPIPSYYKMTVEAAVYGRPLSNVPLPVGPRLPQDTGGM